MLRDGIVTYFFPERIDPKVSWSHQRLDHSDSCDPRKPCGVISHSCLDPVTVPCSSDGSFSVSIYDQC